MRSLGNAGCIVERAQAGSAVGGRDGAKKAARRPRLDPALRELLTGEAERLLLADAGWLWETDAANHISWLSPGFQTQTGLKPADVLGTSRLAALRASDPARARQHGVDVAARHPFSNFHHSMRDGDGATIEVVLSGVPLFDADGVFHGYRGTGRIAPAASVRPTVDARARSSRLIENIGLPMAVDARDHLHSVLAALPAGVAIYGADRRLVRANAAYVAVLPAMAAAILPGRLLTDALRLAHGAGYFRQSGDIVLDSLYDSDPERWIEAYADYWVKPHGPVERLGPDGRWYMVYGQLTDAGEFIRVRVDITDMKQRERVLRETSRDNALFRSLIDHVPVSIYAKREDLRLVYANEGWSDLVGVPREQAIGKTDIELLGEAGEEFARSDREVIASGAAVESEETLVTATGETRHYFARKAIVKAPDGETYLIGSTADISDLKKREEELREAEIRAVAADRAKSEFLANMSHEIRTPMNGVLGMAELLAKSELTPRQRTFADIILKSGNALLTIINDILDFSKIDAGQLHLESAPFSLADAIADVATLVAPRAREKDLEVIVRVDPSLPAEFAGDVGRMRQILTNLIGNAVKFTERGHVLVDVSGEIGDGVTRLRIAVADTGIGIPDDKRELIFDKFAQVDGSSTRRHEGTGLGLAITQGLVSLMGGRISLESVAGQGSTFTVELDLPQVGQRSRRAHAPVDVSGARIVIADDHPVNRAILLEQMASWGFDACAGVDGAEALAVLHAAREAGVAVDCVILDYQMPGMSGLDVARAMRADPALATLPVVLLTSVDQSLTLAQTAGLGIEAQLVKPARSSQLLEAIVTTIQKQRSFVRFSAGEIGAVAEPAAPSPVRDGHAFRVLVAEDNEVNQLVFSQILGEAGISFEIVGNGRLAVEHWHIHRPDLILMDVAMPEMGGFEATRAIREMERAEASHVPIIGVTAHALKGDRERCIEAGMDDYLPKPISPDALTAKIAHWRGEERHRRAS